MSDLHAWWQCRCFWHPKSSQPSPELICTNLVVRERKARSKRSLWLARKLYATLVSFETFLMSSDSWQSSFERLLIVHMILLSDTVLRGDWSLGRQGCNSPQLASARKSGNIDCACCFLKWWKDKSGVSTSRQSFYLGNQPSKLGSCSNCKQSLGYCRWSFERWAIYLSRTSLFACIGRPLSSGTPLFNCYRMQHWCSKIHHNYHYLKLPLLLKHSGLS